MRSMREGRPHSATSTLISEEQHAQKKGDALHVRESSERLTPIQRRTWSTTKARQLAAYPGQQPQAQQQEHVGTSGNAPRRAVRRGLHPHQVLLSAQQIPSFVGIQGKPISSAWSPEAPQSETGGFIGRFKAPAVTKRKRAGHEEVAAKTERRSVGPYKQKVNDLLHIIIALLSY